MRKLAIAAAAFSLAVFSANYFNAPVFLRVLCLLCAVSGCIMLPFRKNKRILAAIIAVFSLALGFSVYWIHYDLTVEKAISVSDAEMEYTARVIDFPSEGGNCSRVPLRLCSTSCKGMKAYVYDYEGRLSELKPGMKIRFNSSLRYVGDERYDNYDYLLSSGFYLRGEFTSDVRLLNTGFCISALPAVFKHRLVEICTDLFPEDTSSFFISLLTGDKSRLYDSGTVYLDLSRAGFVHIVAVSGMHVAFVVGLFRILFGKSRRHTLFCIVLIWFFISVTGFSPSAVRAGIMQTVLLMAPVLYRENDTLTSLFFAMMLILLSNPFAAKSTSLQLSFGATLGICLFSEKIDTAFLSCFTSDKVRSRLRYPAGILAVSIAVSCFTVPICLADYGMVSLISPLTNLLALWAVPVCFAGGAAACIIYLAFPAAGVFAGKVLSWFARYVFSVCRVLSRVPYFAVYSASENAIILVAVIYICIALIVISKDKTSFKFVSSFFISIFLLSLFFLYSYLSSRIPFAVYTAVDVGQGQCIAARSKERTVLVDCGSSSFDCDAGVSAADCLRSDGIYSVDTLVLTHFHSDHANGVSNLFQLIKIDTLVMPDRRGCDDELFDELLSLASDCGVKVYLVNSRCRMTVGNLALELFPAGDSFNDDNEACMAVRVSAGDFDMMITGDSYSDREYNLLSEGNIGSTEVIVAGHHGSKTSSCEEYLRESGGILAIISAGRGNHYGHPSEEVLERFSRLGYSIFRTDLNGDISVIYYD